MKCLNREVSMDIDKVYKLYLKRASKDHSDKKTIDKDLFIMFWNLTDAFREGIIEYIKETEEF